jgi:hypothetical protein
MEDNAATTLLRELESFQLGTLAALIALKTAIQASPGFNQTVLEDVVLVLLAAPPRVDDFISFEGPLKALLGDRPDLLQAVLHEN